MKIKVLLLFIIITVLLTSCGTGRTVDEAKIPVINENDYLSAKVVKESDNRILFKDTISFSKAYPNAVITDLTDLTKPRADATAKFIDEQGIIYYDAERSDTQSTGEIYSYHPFTKDWKTLIRTDENHNCNVILANEKYLLWREDKNANWKKASLHLFNLDTLNDIKFYEYAIDPATDLMYTWPFSTPVLIGDNIYFDDIVGMDKNGLYKIKMFSYSISENKVTMLDEDAKWPMEYQSKAAWLKMSEDKENSLFYSSQHEKCLFKTETRLGTAFTASGNLIVANDYMSQALYDNLSKASDKQAEFKDTVKNPAVSSYGIKLLVNEQVRPVIVVNKGFITNPITNGDLVGWYGSDVGFPMVYSYTMDKLIEFDQFPVESVFAYSFIFSKSHMFLGFAAEDGTQYAYMLELKS